MNPREEKALEIIRKGAITQINRSWVVPSQTESGAYIVQYKGDKLVCTCKDYEGHQGKCKHIYAVEFFRLNKYPDKEIPIEAAEPSKTYPQAWARYNAAQTQEKECFAGLLRELCDGILQPYPGRGRPRLRLSDVVFSAVMKTYTTFSGRRATTDLKECKEKGLVARAPHYNSIFNYLDNEALTPILKRLIEESSLPLKGVEHDFAIDSSGFSTCTHVRWYDTKYGEVKSQQKWLKAHLMCGVKTNIVTSVEVTDSHVNDNTQFVPLLAKTAKNFTVREVSADKAYVADRHLQCAAAIGATAYIPFKSNNIWEGSALWSRMYHLYKFNREEFSAHYHKRSNVETTFSMIKRKLGPALRAKSPAAQINEVLCKILAHNICCLVSSIYELDLAPTFWAENTFAQQRIA